MPIKDKNGNVYQLRGPNPLLRDQADWDKTKIKLINLGWRSEVVSDSRNPITEEKSNIINIRDELHLEDNPAESRIVSAREFIQEVREEPAIVETKPRQSTVPQPDVVITVDPKLARILKERGVEFHCAPVVSFREHKDEFYGSSYQTPVFGDQYIFDAVIIEESDLQIQFWGVKAVTKGSVIYRKNKDGDRWWTIERVEAKTGGYLVIANPSEFNPDFS
jgi:hypothetical protein